jgi:hypothetical protein
MLRVLRVLRVLRALRALRGFAFAGIAAIVLVAALNFGPLDFRSNGQFTPQRFQNWYLANQFAGTTAVLASFAAGVLALTVAWQRNRQPWVALLIVGLILDAYNALLLNLLIVVAGIPDGALYSAAGGLANWLVLVVAPAWPVVVALAYAARFRADEALPAPASTPPSGDAQDPMELHYSRLEEREELG